MIVTSQPASLYGELRVGGWVPPTSWAVRPFKVGQRAPFNPDEHDPLCSFSHLDVRDPSGVPNRPRRQLCVILGRGPSSRTTSRVCVCVFLSRSTLPRLCFALTGSVRRAPRNDNEARIEGCVAGLLAQLGDRRRSLNARLLSWNRLGVRSVALVRHGTR